ncbi:MAG: sigma-70 family RNA polymerase sigma factor [Chloroflexales bacterium]|nr:sigma-70 family RNA polymerase sigma factor [Chloroflexales bacterium]
MNQRTSGDVAALRDEELLALIVRRDSAALGAIYDRYGRLVFTIALRITGDRETAEEVTQDVFQNVWQSAGGFQASSGSFSAWLMGISRHRAIDATRSRRYRARAREEDLSFDYPTDDTNSPENQADARLLRETVYAALRELPPAQRQAIELAYYGGLTRAEIAERLGEPLGTVKTRLRLGMQKLKVLFVKGDIEQEA